MPHGRCRSLAHPSRTSKQQQYTRNGSASTRRPPPSSPRTHTTDRKRGSRNEKQARSPAAHDAARHIDSLPRLRLFSWHCPLSSALASATAPVSPMPFPAASQPAHPNSSSTPATGQHQRAAHRPPVHARTHTTDRKHGSRNEKQARSPAAHDAARHIDSPSRLSSVVEHSSALVYIGCSCTSDIELACFSLPHPPSLLHT